MSIALCHTTTYRSSSAIPYCNYLMQTECEAATFYHRKKLNQQELKFEEFCDFFRGFIRWRDTVA